MPWEFVINFFFQFQLTFLHFSRFFVSKFQINKCLSLILTMLTLFGTYLYCLILPYQVGSSLEIISENSRTKGRNKKKSWLAIGHSIPCLAYYKVCRNETKSLRGLKDFGISYLIFRCIYSNRLKHVCYIIFSLTQVRFIDLSYCF